MKCTTSEKQGPASNLIQYPVKCTTSEKQGPASIVFFMIVMVCFKRQMDIGHGSGGR